MLPLFYRLGFKICKRLRPKNLLEDLCNTFDFIITLRLQTLFFFLFS